MNSVLSRLKEISSAVMYAAEGHDLEVVLQRIAQISRELAQTKYAALGVPDGQGGLRYFMTAGMTDEQMERIKHLPRGHGLIGAIMRGRETIRLDDMSDDARSVGFPDNHPPMSSFLGVPIIVANHLYGMLYLADKENGEKFTNDDQLLIETMAGYAALAIAGAELGTQRSRLRLLEERERIGMELHDGVIQSLYGIGMQVDFLRQNSETTPQQSESLSVIVDELDETIEEIRRFIGDLRRRGHDPMTVKECIEHLRDRLFPPKHIDITINAPETQPPFTPAVFESVCLIVNEAMSNAIRHANASEIDIYVEHNRSRFTVCVEDDGSGFDIDQAHNSNSTGGLGLRNMMQRAHIYGGNIHIDSQPGKGTRLEVTIPIK